MSHQPVQAHMYLGMYLEGRSKSKYGTTPGFINLVLYAIGEL